MPAPPAASPTGPTCGTAGRYRNVNLQNFKLGRCWDYSLDRSPCSMWLSADLTRRAEDLKVTAVEAQYENPEPF
jgi:hypothetical protein